MNRPRIPNKHSHYTVLYGQLQTSCKSRKIELKISREDMMEVIHKNCYYCGGEPSNKCQPKNLGKTEPLIYNGIDRIDSSKGYELGNIVPCCKYCNWGKNTMTQQEFYRHIQKTYNHIVKTKQLDNGGDDLESNA